MPTKSQWVSSSPKSKSPSFSDVKIDWPNINYLPASISSIASVTPSSGKIPYFTGANSAALADFGSVGMQLVAATSQSGARSAIDAAVSSHTHTSPSSGSWWTGYAKVGGGGVCEIGKYLDFHETSSDTSDYTGRIFVESGYFKFWGCLIKTRDGLLSSASPSYGFISEDGLGLYKHSVGKIGVMSGGVSTTIIGPSSLSPGSDNSKTCGEPNLRWSVFYGATAVINTSDARKKTPPRKFTDAEIKAASALSREIKFFQFLESIEEKGEDKARLHCGMTVQRCMEIMSSFGLDPFRYAMICYDSWPESYEYKQPSFGDDVKLSVIDDYGSVVGSFEIPGACHDDFVAIKPAGDIYSLRESQVLFFMARAAEERMAEIERRLGIL